MLNIKSHLKTRHFCMGKRKRGKRELKRRERRGEERARHRRRENIRPEMRSVRCINSFLFYLSLLIFMYLLIKCISYMHIYEKNIRNICSARILILYFLPDTQIFHLFTYLNNSY